MSNWTAPVFAQRAKGSERMVRKTSIAVFRQIEAEGLLSKRRFQAYKVLFDMGPLTAMEVSHAARIPGLWKRCSELKEMGVVEEVGERTCKVTGRLAYLLDVNENKPVKKVKTQKPPIEKCLMAIAIAARQLGAECICHIHLPPCPCCKAINDMEQALE